MFLTSQLQSLLHCDDIEFAEDLVEDIAIERLCRTCLSEGAEIDLSNRSLSMINIKGSVVHVFKMFELATGIKINSEDEFPVYICRSCLKAISSSYAFRIQSQRAAQILHKIRFSISKEPTASQDITELEELHNLHNTEDTGNEQDLICQDDVSLNGDNTWHSNEMTGIDHEVKVEFASDDEGDLLKMSVESTAIICSLCSKGFAYKRDIVQHYRDLHPDYKPFTCEKCPATFTHVQSMRRHLKTHATVNKENMCCFCSRLFYRADDLRRHVRTHTNERPFHCTQCSKAFKQQTELKDHMLSHSSEKNYRCALCSKEWKSRNGWYLHTRSQCDGREKHRTRKNKEGKTGRTRRSANTE